MMMPQPAGWYDDPDGSDAERYFDGQVWTPQRRRKQPTPKPTSQASNPHQPGRAAAGPHVPPAPTGPAVPYYANPPTGPSGAYWPPPTPSGPVHQGQRLSTGAKIGLAAAAGVALLIIASVIASVASSRDEWSYHLGYSSGDTALKLVHEGETDQIACKDLLIGAEMPPPLGAEKSGHTIQTDDFMAGCFDSLHKLGG